MVRQTLFIIACFAFMTVACKSDSKESTSETTVDTTMVTQPLVEISLDSAAVAEDNMRAAPAPSSTTSKPATTKPAATKPAATSKTEPAETTTHPVAAVATSNIPPSPPSPGYVEFPSKRATYPGGQAALNKYLADNIKYPPMARDNKVQGTVYAYILVDEQGNIVDVTFPKPLGSGLEEEVARVIKGMPDLIPAEDNSKPVKTKYMLPVKFTLK